MNTVRIYEIRLQGYLRADWRDWFGTMTMSQLPNGDTLLRGPVDQTALFGVLAQVRNLGLVLLALNIAAAHAADEVD